MTGSAGKSPNFYPVTGHCFQGLQNGRHGPGGGTERWDGKTQLRAAAEQRTFQEEALERGPGRVGPRGLTR